MNKKRVIILFSILAATCLITLLTVVLKMKVNNHKTAVQEPGITIESTEEPSSAQSVSTNVQSTGESITEGFDSYETDSAAPYYRVTVRNMWDLPDKFASDMRPEMPYYIQLYFNNVLGEEHFKDTYNVTILKDTATDSSDGIAAVDATVAELPNITLHIEFDYYDMVYGVSSSLGDYSIDALEKKHAENKANVNIDAHDYDNTDESLPVNDMTCESSED